MEKLIDDVDNLALWKTVRAMIASALQLLRGETPQRFLYGAWKRLRQAENKVRERLALMAMRIEFTPSAPSPEVKPTEK